MDDAPHTQGAVGGVARRPGQALVQGAGSVPGRAHTRDRHPRHERARLARRRAASPRLPRSVQQPPTHTGPMTMATRTTRRSHTFSGVLHGPHGSGEYDYHVFLDGKYIGRLTEDRFTKLWYARGGRRRTPKQFSNRAAALRWLRKQIGRAH